MQASRLLWVTVCVLAVVVCLLPENTAAQTEGKRGKGNKKKSRGGGRIRCTNLTTFKVKAKRVQKKGIALECTSPPEGVTEQGLIAGVTVAGHSKSCQGLTPHMFVQANSCYWKKKCTIKSRKGGKSYLLKIFQGHPSDCVLAQPKHFIYSYQCVYAKVVSLDDADDMTAMTEVRGVLLSHAQHPWLYSPHSESHARNLTLKKPPGYSALVYTIRSLHLMVNDKLTVTSSGHQPRVFGHDDTQHLTHVLHSHDVTFHLNTTDHSTGGEGFVVCFQWITAEQEPTLHSMDACTDLLKDEQCKEKQRGGKRGGRKGKGRRGSRGESRRAE